jgi:GDP-L-fucose synthase
VEGDFYNGRPHESVEFFGLAKRGVETYARAMNKNFGTSFVTLGITNLYGPGDSTDLNKTKVTMALVKKFVDAHINKDPSVIVYGDGSPLRDLLYVDDAAFFIRKAMEKYEDKESVLNIGSGKEISIKDLAEKVKGLVGYEGEIEWIKSAPNGQMRKFIDCSKLSKEIGFNPNYLVPIEAGLQKTINYYKESCFTGVS